MMQRTPLAVAVMLAAGAAARPAVAAPFDAKAVPADARWVVHVDADAARDADVGRAVRDQLAGNAEARANLAKVTAATGVRVEQDLHDVTMFGSAPGDESVVVVVRSANLDRRRMADVVAVLPGYATHAVGGRSLVQWDQDGKVLHGGFHGDDAVVLGRSEANVAAALDALDGKAAAPADGPLAGRTPPATRPAVAAGEHPLLYLALTDLPALAKGGGADVPGPLRQVEGGRLAVVESGATLLVRADLTATTPEAANQLRTAAEGLKAMVAFAAMGSDADANTKAASAALQHAVVGRGDRTVTVDLPIPAAVVTDAIRTGKVNVDVHADGATRPSASVSVKVGGDDKPAK